MEGKQKRIAYWAIGAIVVAGVIWAVTKPAVIPESGVGPEASPTTSTAGKPSSAPKTYSDAINRYANSRIQFDMLCQAIPPSSTFKQGATIMLDNRSGDARTVSVGGVKYSLAGYGWKIITLSSKTLPATLTIDCGSGRNVGTILLQK